MIDKEAIYFEVQGEFKRRWQHLCIEYRSCLYMTLVGGMVLAKHGVRGVPQGGSMQFPMVDLAQDDGVMNTHFAFVWDPESLDSRLAMAQDMLPEMHVWIGIPDTQEIVDFNTGTFPDFAKSINLDWPGAKPPKYIWDTCQALDKKGIVYRPNRKATQLAMYAMARINANYVKSILQS